MPPARAASRVDEAVRGLGLLRRRRARDAVSCALCLCGIHRARTAARRSDPYLPQARRTGLLGSDRGCRRLMPGYESAAQGDVLLGADLGVVVGPALAGIVQEADPEQVIFGAIIDQQMGISVALRGNDGDRRIELQDGHGPAFKQDKRSTCLKT